MQHEVIIIGGSYAGLSAALQLARARRTVLLVDSGQRRNRFAATSHGFLGRDGTSPAQIADEARAQVLAYPGVRWADGTVAQLHGQADAFEVTLADGSVHTGRRLILAMGLVDRLPAIAGLAERWGRQAFVCPYCHGYELHQGRIGVVATTALAAHQASMLPDWGATQLFLNDTLVLDRAQHAQLQARGVQVVPGAVTALQGEGDLLQVLLRDGRTFALDGVFITPQTEISPLVAQLGCGTSDGPLGSHLAVDAMQATTVPGVFACGDIASPAASVAFAVASGAMAGVATHRTLMFGLGH
ncbi:NAD(P)/FAD-dependent oxidoreductase [Xanthomonas vesicatoria]|uniref:NAD(P)/FAD-dependent oxidoreductase n=1 Tax=Xanthomonas vesicatoria TaxID=56460 RepID=A0AAJ0N476_9XANT|nr:NAD(P)/FAD-dependent oxidoreductase [Xanthomonas vesicatoria]APO96342.1 thioredoxin reductase [Xanthomonas vesicatoria]KHM95020.1 thioredoxin reductase [Xanthomonas vesicatoria]KHM96877.1 thioredoxin reductase [Xanthomonas vesicatoria]KTF37913.1 thioredoxin reductase [Xanthomonas vesicatoria]MCC8557454.1 NAD(P)/FAD-dependent oxidoreductase [Xanthomonas vesicatoria]